MMQQSQFYRQRGIVDQESLEAKNILVSGCSLGVSNLLVLLDQVGFGHGAGKIAILPPAQEPNSPFFSLYFDQAETWGALAELRGERFELIDSTANRHDFDYHLSINPTDFISADLYSYFSGPRAKLSRSQIEINLNDNHILSQSMSVVCASAMIHQMINDLALISKVKISDAWITMTCRVETTDVEEASEYITGLNGELLDFTPTSDGLALLARYRIRHDIDLNPFKFINREMQKPKIHELISEDVGIIKWDDTTNALNQSWEIGNRKLLFLGAGALGSWSIPLFAKEMVSGSINIVDGDDEIEIHNLNRQVMYNQGDIGNPKAQVAQKRISSLNVELMVNCYSEYLNPGHISSLELDIEFDDLDFPTSNLPQTIENSDIYFACLDNMLARKILSDAATIYDKPMINGATEAFTGIVEQLGKNNSCMVCRYGRETATSTEVVSCTEEGERPIASIVTSSAWTGAMMATLGMIHFHPSADLSKLRYTLDEGKISSIIAEKPPWFNEDCIYHI